MERLFTLLTLALLTGCATTPFKKELPEALIYQSPKSADSATITGNMQPRYTSLVGDRILYIVEIDGKRVPLEGEKHYSATWDRIYPLTAGEHTLKVGYRMAGHRVGPTTITFNAKPHHQYQLDFKTDIGTKWFSDDSYVDFWIVDKQSNNPVTEVVRITPNPQPSVISYPIIINNK